MAKLTNGCSIYVVFGGKKVKLPVNPEEVTIERPTDNNTYNVLGIGEIVIPRKPSLQTASWESFFPGERNAPYVNSRAKSPGKYVELFEKALKKKQICRLIVSRSGSFDTNMKCLVSSFETTDRGGEPDDIYYSVEFTEYRSYAPESITIVTGGEAVGAEPVQAAVETVRPVETPVLRVGAPVTVNGKYWYDSYGAKPFGTANNLSTEVTRIVPGNPYPVHVGHYGWVQESQLQITG